MSRKALIMTGAIIGTTVGGYLPVLCGGSAFSFVSILGSGAGGLVGIWLMYVITKNMGW